MDVKPQTVFEYITQEEAVWKTTRVPITGSKDWNMHEHIERCTNVANGWFHKGQNDGNRPYNDIVTPIKNVAFRSEGFNVKDIVPFVNDALHYYKSFLIKKFHPQWARKHELDTLIDDAVETSVIYDLLLMKKAGGSIPEVVPLQTIAFCDQTDVLAGPLCLKHQYSESELEEFKGKWWNDKIEEALAMAKYEKTVANANNQTVKTPGKYLTVYELHGTLPGMWLKNQEDGNIAQLQIVTYWNDSKGNKNGITLFSGKEPKSIFRALKIDRIGSYGRTCGRSFIETLFEPQVWNNYSEIKIKQMLDAAVDLFVTDDDELGNQKLSNLKINTILKTAQGKTLTRVNSQLQNLTAFSNYQAQKENSARIIGSASDAQLGVNPVSGTPFALQNLVVQQGQGIHEYRQGKIATFFADVLYRDWILDAIVKEMDSGKTFSETLTLEEIQEIKETVITNRLNQKKIDLVLSGILVTPEMESGLDKTLRAEFDAGGSRKFFEILKGELNSLPIDVFVNINGKQKNMAQEVDKLSNLIRAVMANPTAFSQIPGISKVFNQLLENSGLNPVDFSQIANTSVQQPIQQTKELIPVT